MDRSTVASLSVAIPTISSSLDARFLSGLKNERMIAANIFPTQKTDQLSETDRIQLVYDVKSALYASKICSYAQGLNLIRAKSEEKGWDISLDELVRIWKDGCIIRAKFLDRIRLAYKKDPQLSSLLIDEMFSKEIDSRDACWRRVVTLVISSGIALPSMSASLAYFDAYRRANSPANLIQRPA